MRILIISSITCNLWFCAIAQTDALQGKYEVSEKAILEFHNLISQSKDRDFYATLLINKEKNKLDDWIYYKVIQEYTRSEFQSRGSEFQNLFVWYCLNKTGFDVRLRYTEKEYLLYVYTEDVTTGTPFFLDNEKGKFVCLNYNKEIDTTTFKHSKFILNQSGELFSFKINSVFSFQTIKPEYFAKGFYDSLFSNQFVEFKIRVNEIMFNWMSSYPNLECKDAFNVPLSDEAYNSLIPKLEGLLLGKDSIEIAQFIFYFVRDAFLLGDKSDLEYLGSNKIFTPEFALGNSFISSNGFSSLYYYLIKTLLDIPIIVIYYPEQNHYNVGISFGSLGVQGNFIYNERSYFISELTSGDTDSNKEEFGTNVLYRTSPYKVILEYIPQ